MKSAVSIVSSAVAKWQNALFYLTHSIIKLHEGDM